MQTVPTPDTRVQRSRGGFPAVGRDRELGRCVELAGEAARGLWGDPGASRAPWLNRVEASGTVRPPLPGGFRGLRAGISERVVGRNGDTRIGNEKTSLLREVETSTRKVFLIEFDAARLGR